jgi:hypothetical protein
VLPWVSVRVGFVTPLLWPRFGPPWVAVLRDLGADVVLPAPEAVAEALADPRAAALPGLLPRLATAAALACGEVDLLLAPELMPPRDGGPGSAQDPWTAELPAMLSRTLAGAAPVLGLPSERGAHVAGRAMAILTRVHRDAGPVRRAWERHKRDLETPWRPAAGGGTRAVGGSGRSVALVASPWWLAPASLALLTGDDERITGQHELEPAEARAEGWRVRAEFAESDAETIGAARRFARQGGVDVVRLVVDPEAPSTPWLERRVREVAARALEVVPLDAVADAATWARALTPADRGA